MLNLVYRKSESNDMPMEVDTVSSPTTVYLRRNIRTEERQDVETGTTRTVYVYEELKMSKTEYIDVLRKQQEITDEAVQELILAMEA